MSQPNERAWDTGLQLFGEEHMRRTIKRFADIEPGFGDLVLSFVHGGMYSRGVLDHKTRELVAVGALALVGATGELDTHIKAALRQGATREEVREVLLQMAVYGGFPRALIAIERYQQVIREQDGAE